MPKASPWENQGCELLAWNVPAPGEDLIISKTKATVSKD